MVGAWRRTGGTGGGQVGGCPRVYGVALYGVALYGVALYGVALYGVALYGVAPRNLSIEVRLT